jgi:hypothetical protein
VAAGYLYLENSSKSLIATGQPAPFTCATCQLVGASGAYNEAIALDQSYYVFFQYMMTLHDGSGWVDDGSGASCVGYGTPTVYCEFQAGPFSSNIIL